MERSERLDDITLIEFLYELSPEDAKDYLSKLDVLVTEEETRMAG